MPYDNIVIKKPYYDVDRFGSYVHYKSIERRKKLRKFLSKAFAIFDLCIVFALFILSIVLIFNIFKFAKNNISLNTGRTKVVELRTDLDKITKANIDRKEEIINTLNLEDIKLKAMFNFDMVSPTEKSTIYFDTID